MITRSLQGLIEADNNDADTDMVEYATTLGDHTGSEFSMSQLRQWYTECIEHHEECAGALPSTAYTPSRLVQISSNLGEELGIRLRQRADLDANLRYATVSHCWGDKMPFQLLRKNLKKCLSKIELREISRVFRDAVSVAWQLGIGYLWIDSLCKLVKLVVRTPELMKRRYYPRSAGRLD
jgi:hypothetical protein